MIKSPPLLSRGPGPCRTHTEEGRCSGFGRERRERHKSLWPWATSSWKTLQLAGSEVSALARLPPPLPRRITGQTAEAQCQLFAPGVLGALCGSVLRGFYQEPSERLLQHLASLAQSAWLVLSLTSKAELLRFTVISLSFWFASTSGSEELGSHND